MHESPVSQRGDVFEILPHFPRIYSQQPCGMVPQKSYNLYYVEEHPIPSDWKIIQAKFSETYTAAGALGTGH